jgi:hypothetical protein
VHDSPTTLRVLFAIVDLGVLLLIGLGSPGPQSWRLAFVLFYGFNPLVLLGWTVYAEDKTILFAGIAVLILALERQRHWTAWLATTFLTAFKFLGAFVVPVLTLHAVRQRRAVILPLVVLVGVVAASAAFWFPDSLHAFSRRSVRLDLNPPINASPVLLLAKIGIYNTVEPRVLTVIGVLVVFGLFAIRRIDICEAVVLSVLAGYVFLPDDAFDRLLLITLPFLLILRPKPWQWLLLWAVSSVAALGAVVATHGVPHFLSGVGDGLRSVFGGHEGTLRHVFWMSLPLAVVLVMFGLARRTRTPAAARRPAG